MITESLTPEAPATIRRLDIVKLGPAAQETHVVMSDPFKGRVHVKQETTGAQRFVAIARCIVIGHYEDYQHGRLVR